MIFFSIIVGSIPSLLWLYFFLKEDLHPEPKKTLLTVFLIGALTTFIALFFQILLQNLFKNFTINNYGSINLFVFAAIEEILKFALVFWFTRKNKEFNEPIDAMIYLITASLGFAMVENIAIAISNNNILETANTLILRFTGATLLHALSSGIVGYYWAMGIIKKKIKPQVIKGLIFASLLHGIFNWLIIFSKEEIFYSAILLSIAALLVFWDFEKIKIKSGTN